MSNAGRDDDIVRCYIRKQEEIDRTTDHIFGCTRSHTETIDPNSSHCIVLYSNHRAGIQFNGKFF